MCIRVCMIVCVYVNLPGLLCIVYVYRPVCACVCIDACRQVMHVCMYVPMCARMHAHMCVRAVGSMLRVYV